MIRIRAANVDDAEAIAQIYAPYVKDTPVSFELEPPSAAVMAHRIAESVGDYPWLISKFNDSVVGYAYAAAHRPRPGYRWTVNVTIYLAQPCCGRGIGKRLYTALIETLRQQQFRSAFAEIVVPNEASVRLHEGVGFRHIGTHNQIGFKLGKWHDIGYWRLGLTEGDKTPEELIPFARFRDGSAFSTIMSALST